MQIFDAPTREKCTIRRARTNTPLQAFVTLNDTQFVEASRHLAQRMIRQGGSDRDARLELGFRLTTARPPTKQERIVLAEVLDSALTRYQEDLDSAQALLKIGESPVDEAIGTAELAAWTIVASTLMNLDETLTRE